MALCKTVMMQGLSVVDRLLTFRDHGITRIAKFDTIQWRTPIRQAGALQAFYPNAPQAAPAFPLYGVANQQSSVVFFICPGRRSWRPCPADQGRPPARCRPAGQARNPWPSSGSCRWWWWCQSPDRCWAWSWRSRPKFRSSSGQRKSRLQPLPPRFRDAVQLNPRGAALIRGSAAPGGDRTRMDGFG